MMKTLLPLILCTLLAVAGCDNDDPAPISSERLTGTLVGRVRLFDPRGADVSDAQGVRVAILGSSIETTSASDGSWRLEDLPAGTYDLSFTRVGYGEGRIYGYQFVGGGRASTGTVQLSQKPLGRITGIAGRPDSVIVGFDVRDSAAGVVDTIWRGDYFHVTGTALPDSPPLSGFLLVFDTTARVSLSPGEHIATLGVTYDGSAVPRSVIDEFIPGQRVRSATNRPSRTSLFMRAYFISEIVTQYYDLDANALVVTSVSEPSPVASITVP